MKQLFSLGGIAATVILLLLGAGAWAGQSVQASYPREAQDSQPTGAKQEAGNTGITAPGPAQPDVSSCNATTITLPGTGNASPYPSNITISGQSGVLVALTVTLNSITHTNPDDIDVLLVGPAGQDVMLMSDAGGSSNISNVTLIFDDAAATTLPDLSLIHI